MLRAEGSPERRDNQVTHGGSHEKPPGEPAWSWGDWWSWEGSRVPPASIPISWLCPSQQCSPTPERWLCQGGSNPILRSSSARAARRDLPVHGWETGPKTPREEQLFPLGHCAPRAPQARLCQRCPTHRQTSSFCFRKACLLKVRPFIIMKVKFLISQRLGHNLCGWDPSWSSLAP